MENIETFDNNLTIKEKPIRVYVKRNNHGKIIKVNSELFIDDLNGWEFYDEGYGDKYAHAQNQYFEKEKEF